MSGLARKVAIPTLALLIVQLAGALVIQSVMTGIFRDAFLAHMYLGIEDSGMLGDCTSRPGPWRPDNASGWTVWPVSPDGVVVGDALPVPEVTLPEPGEAVSFETDALFVTVYASTTPGCGGLVHAMERADGSIAPPAQIATLVGLRLALALAIGVALVAFTAVPLVRRIRALSEAMNGIVDAGFDGEIEDPVPDELGDVARSFNAATASVREQLDRLEHRDAVMRRALADFAHDLRTPLTTLQLSTSSLPDTEASTMIRTELSYLHGMMQNFESVLVGEDGEVGTLALDSLVERVQHRFEPQARDRDVSLKVALPDATLHVEADVVLVERAVGNLVQNALRFARAHVVVLLFRDGEEARIEVRDDGPGFGPSLERAAERGVRGEDAEGVGLGLGLAIAETAARRFGGRLELRNDDEATLAAIVLPLAAV